MRKDPKDPTGHICDCTKPAIKKKGQSWVCARCDRIEEQMHGTKNRRLMHDPPPIPPEPEPA